MSLTARNAQVYKGTAAVTYGSGSGVSNRELQGTASVTYGGAPTSNTALSLPGTSGNYMNLGSTHPAHFDTRSSNLFMEAWIYSIAATGGNQQVIAVTDATSSDWNMFIGTDNIVHFGYWAPSYTQVTTGAISFAAWNHVALSWNPTTRAMYVFLNGVVSGPTTAGTTGVYTSSREVRIGSETTASVFNGYVRDLRVVQGGTVPTSSFTPVQAPFRLNTPSYVTGGSTVLSLAEQYFYPSWVSLPGTSGNFMTLGATHPAHFDTRSSTLFAEAWIYPIAANGSVNQQIMAVTDASTTDWNLFIGTDNILHFGYWAPTYNDITSGTITFQKWNHVAISWSPFTLNQYVFLNGVASAARLRTATGVYSESREFRIGTETTGSVFNGYIQDLRVVRGGTVPTTSFTPAAAPFGLASPSYVSGGTTVLSLATQYYQTTTNGLLPQVFLAPSGTYPSYTTTSAPVFSSSNVAFTGAGFSAGNFINFGQTTITMALGYSIVFQFAWTGSYQSAYERIFDFGVAGGNSNAIIVYRNGTGSTINFGNFTGTSAQTITSTSTFPQNTVSGTVVCIYDPASTGSLKMYVNGSLQATLTGITIIPNGSFPSSLIAATNATGADPFSNVSIYSMKFYNRVLSATEIARTASPISSIQFTSRPIFAPVLVSPGNQTFVGSGTFSVEQTALQPLNGITWSARPLGLISLVSSTDHLIKFSVASTLLFSNTFTVIATNKAGLSSVVQFIVSVTPVQPILTNMALWINPSTYPGTGTTITDSSGNGRTFTFAGTPLPVYVASPVPAFSFIRNSAFSTYNRLERNSIFLGDDMTIQAWIKTTYVGQDTWHYLLMTIMATEVGGPGNDWGFGVNNSGKLAFGAGTSDTTIASTSSVNTGTWINVAATRVKSSGLITLYINGSSNGSGTGNAGNSLTSATIVWIGSGQDGGYSFGGLIGEVLAYTSALSASDVAYNFNISRSTYGV